MTKIEWAATLNEDGTTTPGQTWNPTVGCRIVSSGCKKCYAMRMAGRLEAMGQEKYAGLTQRVNGHTVWTGEVRPWEPDLLKPLSVRKPTTWFVDSMSDLFFGDEEDRKACERQRVPFIPVPDEYLDRVFAVMALCPQHTFQILTKRPGRMLEYVAGEGASGRVWFHWMALGRAAECLWDRSQPGVLTWPLPNVWIGISAEDQRTADERIPLLLQTPAAVRFLSLEPLLSEIDLTAYLYPLFAADDPRHEPRRNGVEWVICGGESGPGARPCHLDWIRGIVQQCQAAGTACFVKQLGKWIGGEPEHIPSRWLLDDGRVFIPPLLVSRCERPANAVAFGLRDPKGGDISEFPSDLRVRQFPAEAR